jgi:hypothetical protein
VSSSLPQPRLPESNDPAPDPTLEIEKLRAFAANPLRALATDRSILDAALYGILVGNAVTLAGALFEHWPAAPVLWVYWGQSVMIGVLNVIRILCLTEFSTAGFTSNGSQVPETEKGKVNTAVFFAIHYGFFHLVYALFLSSGVLGGKMSGWMPATVLLNVAIFAVAYGFPMMKTHGHDLKSKRPNLGALMFYPYLRIIPMHLTIILGSAFPLGALPLFILLKTGSDVGLHIVERKLFMAPVE